MGGDALPSGLSVRSSNYLYRVRSGKKGLSCRGVLRLFKAFIFNLSLFVAFPCFVLLCIFARLG